MRKFLSILIFLGIFQLGYAQEKTCGIVLDDAKKEFDAGHLSRISNMLKDCLEKGFSDEEKIDAYRLLTITYLYLDDYYQAEESFKKLLETDYEYKVLPTDPIELEYLSREFITTPIVSFSAKVGPNFSTVSVIHRNPLSSEPDTDWNYKPGAGIVGYVGLDLHFSKAFSLNLEFGADYRTFTQTDVLFAVEPQELESLHSSFYGSIPILFKYTLADDLKGKKKGERRIYYPYVYAGYSPSFTLLASTSNNRVPNASPKVAGSSLDVLGKTTFFSQSLIFGIGLKRRINYNYVLVDFRYRFGMTNMLDEKNQFNFENNEIKDEIFKYGIGTDDYRLNGFELTVGYIWPKYKVRRKNSVTIQTFVSDLFSKKNKQDE